MNIQDMYTPDIPLAHLKNNNFTTDAPLDAAQKESVEFIEFKYNLLSLRINQITEKIVPLVQFCKGKNFSVVFEESTHKDGPIIFSSHETGEKYFIVIDNIPEYHPSILKLKTLYRKRMPLIRWRDFWARRAFYANQGALPYFWRETK